MEDFNRIREWMVPLLDARGISPESLARTIGISRSAVYHWFTDLRRPTTNTMRKVCDVLGVDQREGLDQYAPRVRGRPRAIIFK